MNDGMIAILKIAGEIIVAFIGFYSAFYKFKIELAKQNQRQNDRLDAIEKKIDEHNNYGKKFESCDKNIALIQKDIEYLKEEKCQRKKK